ncbi:MAG: HAD family phosphatase [Proteobacteria bacterium]|nr:HAD family phosphatase [Pseudomonadota bacterium]
MKIKNVVFDIGGVLVRWEPLELIKKIFPQANPKEFYQQMRPIWLDLNLGKLTIEEAIRQYEASLGLPKDKLLALMDECIKDQTPLDGSIALLQKLNSSGLNLFAITDNIREIMDYHREVSEFPKYFKDIVVSADIGVLKPDSRIYQHLIDKQHLNPAECVFIDDTLANVEGAIAVGMHAFQFIDMLSCEQELIALIDGFY